MVIYSLSLPLADASHPCRCEAPVRRAGKLIFRLSGCGAYRSAARGRQRQRPADQGGVQQVEGLSNISVIRELLKKHDFSFSKQLGQNFLVDPSVCPKIAELGKAEKGFGIIEIGAGIGVLTNELAKSADKVVSFEIDGRLMPVLYETLAEYQNVRIINADVMKYDLNELFLNDFKGLDVAVCANLPYYITSPVIMKLLESRLPFRTITVMVQKEAAKRLCAPMGSREMGAVSVAVNYFSVPKILFDVSRGSFVPPPHVDSCVMQFALREDIPWRPADEKFFFRVARGAFEQRRKNLVNSVSSALGTDKKIVSEAAASCGLSPNVRPEQLSMEQFVAFSDNLKNALK